MHILESIVTGILLLWLGSMEYRMRRLFEVSDQKPDRIEVKELIDMKQEALKSSDADIKEDVKRLETKIDRLIEMQLNS